MKKDERVHKIGFSDLDGNLKTAIVFLWVIIGLYVITFLFGFIMGLIEAEV